MKTMIILTASISSIKADSVKRVRIYEEKLEVFDHHFRAIFWRDFEKPILNKEIVLV